MQLCRMLGEMGPHLLKRAMCFALLFIIVILPSSLLTLPAVAQSIPTAENRQPLVVSIQVTPDSGSVPLQVTFSSSVSGGLPPYTYSWALVQRECYQGGPCDYSSNSSRWGQSASFTATFEGMSLYSVVLLVRDSRGLVASAAGYVAPGGAQLSVSNAVSQTSCTTPCTVQNTERVAAVGVSSYMVCGFEYETCGAPDQICGGNQTGSEVSCSFSYCTAGPFESACSGPDDILLCDPVYSYTSPCSTVYTPDTGGPQLVSPDVFGDGITASSSSMVVVNGSDNDDPFGAPVTTNSVSASALSGNAPLSVDFTYSNQGLSPCANMTLHDPGTNWNNVTINNVCTIHIGSAGSFDLPMAPVGPTGSLNETFNLPGIYFATLDEGMGYLNSAGSPWGTASSTSVVAVAESPVTDSIERYTSSDGNMTFSFVHSEQGGVGPYTYLWSFGDGTFSNESSPMHTYTSPGVYNVTFWTCDAAYQAQFNASCAGPYGTGWSEGGGVEGCLVLQPAVPACASSSLEIVAGPGNTTTSNSSSVSNTTPQNATLPSLGVYLYLSRPSIILGGESTASAIVSGSSDYALSWTGTVAAGCTGDEDSYACTPTSPGVYQMCVTATDLVTYATGFGCADLTVSAAQLGTPPDVVLLVSSTGGAYTFQAVVLNQEVGLSYSYVWGGDLPSGCSPGDTPVATCTPGPGTYTVSVTVTDSDQLSGTAAQSITTTGTPSVTTSPVHPTGKIVLTQRGLPPGTVWKVYVLGTGFVTTYATSQVEFTVAAPDTYSYFVFPPQGYFASPSSGQVPVVAGGISGIAVTFLPSSPCLSTVSSTGEVTSSTSSLATGSGVQVGVCSGISAQQISSLEVSQSDGAFTLSFNLTGATGTYADPVIEVPTSSLPAGLLPLVSVNGAAVPSSFYQDPSYYYILFSVHFSTDDVGIAFSSAPTNETTGSSTTRAQGGGGGIPEFPPQLIAVAASTAAVVIAYTLLRRPTETKS